MKKQLQLVLLPTENKINALLGYSDKSILFNRPYSKEFSTEELDKILSSYFHLYAISNEIIKKDDFIINTFSKLTGKALFDENKLDPHLHKIIITTDESIGYTDHKISPVPNFCTYPTFTNDFINTYIERYNKGEVLEFVEVEYKKYDGTTPISTTWDGILEVNTNNTVDVSLIEDKLYTKEEVISNLDKYRINYEQFKKDCHFGPNKKEIKEFTDIWIKNNL